MLPPAVAPAAHNDDDRTRLQRFIKDHPYVFEQLKSYKPRPIDVVFNARIGIPSKLTREDVEKMIATERMFTAFEIGPYLHAKGFSTTELPFWTVQFISPDHECRGGYLRFKLNRVLSWLISHPLAASAQTGIQISLVPPPQSNPNRPHRLRHDRRRPPDRRAEHDGHAHAGHRRHRRAGRTLCVEAGADVVRIAVDSTKDAEALAEIRQQTKANLSVDLQENYRLAELSRRTSTRSATTPAISITTSAKSRGRRKSRYLADVAGDNDCAMRVGVNCGSVDPAKKEKYDPSRLDSRRCSKAPSEHCELLDSTRLHALLRLAEGFRSARR